MDGFVAFGAAGTVAQFIGLSVKAFRQCKEIYQHGSTGRVRELLEHASRLESLCQELRASLDKPRPLTQEDQALMDVTNKCLAAAQGLHGLLASLNKSSHNRTIIVWRRYWRTVWRSRRITKSEIGISGLQSELNTHILVSLRTSATYLVLDQQSIFARLEEEQKSLVLQLVRGVQRFSDLANHESQRPSIHVASGHDIALIAESLASIDTSIAYLLRTERKEAFIKTLIFPELEQRHQQIATPYPDTCEWIFADLEETQPHWPTFTDWLASPAQIYWICGKAGSGKSTLMRFIYSDERTRRGFIGAQQPRAEGPLIAAYFMWNAGGWLQKTSAGLLRTILYQIMTREPTAYDDLIQQNPDLPSRRLELNWSNQELLSLLQSSVGLLSKPILLILDGLDEFEGGEEHLLKLIQTVLVYDKAKLCLSSRPSPRLCRYFDSHASLKLEDLNAASINKFVHGRLTNDPDLRTLLVHYSEEESAEFVSKLSNAITYRASGLFLWADFAAQSIRDGLENLDSPQTLFRRFDVLLREMEHMYEQIWQKIEQSPYAEEAKLAFIITVRGEEPLPVLYSILDDYMETGRIRVLVNLSGFKSEHFRGLGVRLLSQCRGLLENTVQDWSRVMSNWENVAELDQIGPTRLVILLNMKVRFMHQSARDFALKKLSSRLANWRILRAQAWNCDSSEGHHTPVATSDVDDRITEFVIKEASGAVTAKVSCSYAREGSIVTVTPRILPALLTGTRSSQQPSTSQPRISTLAQEVLRRDTNSLALTIQSPDNV